MSENFLTVSALRTKVEAELIRDKLESAGIAAVLFEPEGKGDGAPPARIQVQVSPADFERAMQLLFPIPQRAAPAKTEKPPWQCPGCGEQVLGQFPRCWKCGTGRDGSPAPSVTLSAAPSPAAAPTLPVPPLPQPPLAPSSPVPAKSVPAMPPGATAFSPAPRISMPDGTPPPALEIPPIPSGPAAERSKPAMNGESRSSSAQVHSRLTKTSEEEGLSVVVPAWDAATHKPKGDRAGAKKLPTDADDRAARRAWWTAVIGLVIWPLLLYSISVVLILGLTNRPLSSRGTRFFYGALAVNAAFIAFAFVWLGTHR